MKNKRNMIKQCFRLLLRHGRTPTQMETNINEAEVKAKVRVACSACRACNGDDCERCHVLTFDKLLFNSYVPWARNKKNYGRSRILHSHQSLKHA